MDKYEERLLKKLEAYEKYAYAGGFGADWLESVGEGFKLYIQWCVASGESPSITGFEDYIDKHIASAEMREAHNENLHSRENNRRLGL